MRIALDRREASQDEIDLPLQVRRTQRQTLREVVSDDPPVARLHREQIEQQLVLQLRRPGNANSL